MIIPAARQLEELQLIQFSLLPDEILTFLDDEPSVWSQLLEDYIQDPSSIDSLCHWPAAPARCQVKSNRYKIWLEVQFPGSENSMPSVSAKGENVTRTEQEHWQSLIHEKLDEIASSDFPVYELLCLHLLPLLHAQAPTATAADQQLLPVKTATTPGPRFHALFTSHHLISPKKRRSLQQWSGSLKVSGFAKIGYPGVIYAQGEQSSVEEFVANVKAMQWLALRLRFMELLPEGGNEAQAAEGWSEYEKVGEVVEAMRRLGREDWILEMGVGSRNT
ncbi:hypothetical protein B0H10DRAFT_1819474 [Mycena sp. CBHHK59/15]|nr:hypothetical protein B0H10DRAFT_1819474 [Mycena sp. CBHHK59/15]